MLNVPQNLYYDLTAYAAITINDLFQTIRKTD
jgi:hypothetical protein